MLDKFYQFLQEIIEWQEGRAHHPHCHGNPHNACGCSCDCGFKPIGQLMKYISGSKDGKLEFLPVTSKVNIFNPDGSYKYFRGPFDWNEVI